jgi:predicted RNA binding protein YcfA (HicA-like mRNA interferase family)
MAHLTPISWKKFEKFLFYAGCELKRTKGDHRIYWRGGLMRPVVIPTENDLPVFIIRNNLRILGISPDEYSEILKRI